MVVHPLFKPLSLWISPPTAAQQRVKYPISEWLQARVLLPPKNVQLQLVWLRESDTHRTDRRGWHVAANLSRDDIVTICRNIVAKLSVRRQVQAWEFLQTHPEYIFDKND